MFDFIYLLYVYIWSISNALTVRLRLVSQNWSVTPGAFHLEHSTARYAGEQATSVRTRRIYGWCTWVVSVAAPVKWVLESMTEQEQKFCATHRRHATWRHIPTLLSWRHGITRAQPGERYIYYQKFWQYNTDTNINRSDDVRPSQCTSIFGTVDQHLEEWIPVKWTQV